MMRGKTLKIFVMGSDPRALKSVELVNWTGQAFLGRREHRKQIKQLPELAEPVVYLLLSEPNDESGAIDFYVGEAEDFLNRIDDHYRKKDWWTHFIAFVSKDKNLTKAHVRYLEKEIYEKAQEALGTLKLRNIDRPPGASLPVSDEASMHEFFENIVFVLETLGLSYFPMTYATSRELRAVADPVSMEGMEFYITLPKDLTENNSKKYRSFMRVRGDNYVLKKGSFIRKNPRKSFFEQSYFALWRQISTSAKVSIAENSKLLQTTQDIEFRSPSAAAAIVRGGQTNGRLEWRRVVDELSLGECETQSKL